MDTELACTFLAVIATGSGVEASQRRHVTQSPVCTQIQRLEQTPGAELFVRNKAGTTLTPAGPQFLRHAALLTRTVAQARQEIGIVSGFRATLTIGRRIGLWQDFLLRLAGRSTQRLTEGRNTVESHGLGRMSFDAATEFTSRHARARPT